MRDRKKNHAAYGEIESDGVQRHPDEQKNIHGHSGGNTLLNRSHKIYLSAGDAERKGYHIFGQKVYLTNGAPQPRDHPTIVRKGQLCVSEHLFFVTRANVGHAIVKWVATSVFPRNQF